MKVFLSMYDLLLPPGVKGLKSVLEILKNNHTKSEVSRQLISLKKLSWKFREFPRKLLRTERIMKVHNYAEYTLYGWCFSRNYPKIFGTAILKENLLMNAPCFIEEHLWMSVFNEATFKKNLLDVNPPQSWSGKQNDTMVVTAVMILEVVNNWKNVLQINILKKT